MKNRFNFPSWCFIFTDVTLVKINSYKTEKNPILCCVKKYIPAKCLCDVKSQVDSASRYQELPGSSKCGTQGIQNVNTRLAIVFCLRLA